MVLKKGATSIETYLQSKTKTKVSLTCPFYPAECAKAVAKYGSFSKYIIHPKCIFEGKRVLK